MRRYTGVRWLSTDRFVEHLLRVTHKPFTPRQFLVPKKFRAGRAVLASLGEHEAQLNKHRQSIKDWLHRLLRPPTAYLDVSTHKVTDLQVPPLPIPIDLAVLAKKSDAQQMVTSYGEAILANHNLTSQVLAAVGQTLFLLRTPAMVATYVGAYSLLTNKLPESFIEVVSQAKSPRRFKSVEMISEPISNRKRLEDSGERDIFEQYPDHFPDTIRVIRHIVQVRAAEDGTSDADIDLIVMGILPLINPRTPTKTVDDQLELYHIVGEHLKPRTPKRVLFLSQLIIDRKIELAELPEPTRGPLVPPVPRHSWLNRFYMIPQGTIHPRDEAKHWKQQQVVKDALRRAVTVGRMEWEFWVKHYCRNREVQKLLLSQGFMQWAVDATGYWKAQSHPDLRLRFQSSVASDQFYQLFYCLTLPERIKYVARLSKAWNKVREAIGPQMLEVVAKLATWFNGRVGGVDELAVAATVAKLGRVDPATNDTITPVGELGRRYCEYHAARFLIGFRLYLFLVQCRATMAVFDQSYGYQWYQKIGEAVVQGADVDGLVSDEIERIAHVKPGTVDENDIPKINVIIRQPRTPPPHALPIRFDSNLSKLMCFYYGQCRHMLADIDPQLVTKPYVNQLPDTISKLATVASKYYRVQVDKQQQLLGQDLSDLLLGEFAWKVIEATVDWHQSPPPLAKVHSEAQRTPYHQFRYARQMMAQFMAVLYHQHPSMIDHWVAQQVATKRAQIVFEKIKDKV